MRWPLEACIWGCVAERTKHVIRWLEPLVPPPHFQEGEKGWRVMKSLANGDSTQSCLCDKASTKKAKRTRFQEFLVWWTRGGLGRVAHPGRAWNSTPFPHTLHSPSLLAGCSSDCFLKSYLFLAALGLCCCLGAFSGCSERGLLSTCSAWASHCSGFCCCRAQPPGTRALTAAAHGLRSGGSWL